MLSIPTCGRICLQIFQHRGVFGDVPGLSFRPKSQTRLFQRIFKKMFVLHLSVYLHFSRWISGSKAEFVDKPRYLMRHSATISLWRKNYTGAGLVISCIIIYQHLSLVCPLHQPSKGAAGHSGALSSGIASFEILMVSTSKPTWCHRIVRS